MMKATFVVNGHEVEVNFAPWTGRETYKVDGAIVHSNRRYGSRSAQKFLVGEKNMVEVRVARSPEWSCQAFVDDTLFIEEIFPSFKGAKSLYGEAMLDVAPHLFGIGMSVGLFASFFSPLSFRRISISLLVGLLWAAILPLHWRLMARGSLLSGLTLASAILGPQLIFLRMRTPENPIDWAAACQILGLIFATGFGSLWLLQERVRKFLWMKQSKKGSSLAI